MKGRALGKNMFVPSPEDIPPQHLSSLSRRYLSWKTGMIVIIGVLMVFTVLKTLIDNPVITGLSVYDAASQESSRFSGMSSILFIVFAFFAIFLIIVTRKMSIKKRQ